MILIADYGSSTKEEAVYVAKALCICGTQPNHLLEAFVDKNSTHAATIEKLTIVYILFLLAG